MPKYIVPITKGKSTIEIDSEAIPEHVWQHIVAQGLKAVLNGGMSKITKKDTASDEEMQRLAMEQAEANAAAVLDGTLKISGRKSASKVSGKVMTEARNIAKKRVKAMMKDEGIKVSHVPAKEITAAANALIEADPSILEAAKEAVEKIEAAPKVAAFDLKSLIKVDPALKAKADAASAKKKASKPISAAQAGKPKKSKPQAQLNA